MMSNNEMILFFSILILFAVIALLKHATRKSKIRKPSATREMLNRGVPKT